MGKVLTFRTVTVDTHKFALGMTVPAGAVFKYFDMICNSNDNDITTVDEEDIIKWLLATEFKALLLEELEVGSDAFIDYSIKQPIIDASQGKPGDIDILICPSRRPDIAIAFQCKPVIVKSLNEQEDDDVKKLGRVPDLVHQANRQRKIYGFYRNYLALLIKVDARKKLKYNPLSRGINPETFQTIYEFPDRENVHQDVGIVFIEIVQPTGKSFDQYVTVGICIDTEATRLDQLPDLTNRVEEVMKRKGVIVGRT